MSPIARVLASPWLVRLCRIAVGLVMLAAALAKIGDTAAFAAQIHHYRLIPLGADNLLAMTLPWAELLAESDAVFDALIAAAERAPASALTQTAQFFWPDLGGTVPCGVYLLMVSAHHYQAEHLPEVVRSA